MSEFRVSYIEVEAEEARTKRWRTIEEARAFIVGLKRGASVRAVMLSELVEGHKPKRIPNVLKTETHTALIEPVVVETASAATPIRSEPQLDGQPHRHVPFFRRSSPSRG